MTEKKEKKDCIITNVVIYREKLKYSHSIKLMFKCVSFSCSAHAELTRVHFFKDAKHLEIHESCRLLAQLRMYGHKSID